MPSSKAKRPSGSAAKRQSGIQLSGPLLNQSGKKSRRTKSKKKLKKKTKKDMNLPTRLVRLLKYKNRNAQFGSSNSGQRASIPEGSEVAALVRGHGAVPAADNRNSLQVNSSCLLTNSVKNCIKGNSFLPGRPFGCGVRDYSGTSSDGKLSNLKDEDGCASSEDRLIPKEGIIALDCEMVGVGPEGRTSAMARCSIVDYDCNVLYDAYVKPELEILHYRTPWSGIRKHHMDNAIPFREAQQQIASILKGKVLVGHSLRFDIQVLQIRHPSEDTRDTSTYRGLRELAGLTMPSGQHPGLKRLTKLIFGHSIQEGEHCSVEDAKATMNLYKLVERKWEEERVSVFPESDFRASFMDDHFWPDDLE